MAELADHLTYAERPGPTPSAQRSAAGRAPPTRAGSRRCPTDARAEVEKDWGPAPGEVSCRVRRPTGWATSSSRASISAACSSAIQPPRGFGENPVAVYHSPDLAPTHHYLAFYRWLDEGWGAHAVVHVGKHGTLEWLPGKGVGSRRRASPTPRWAACRSSTPSS